MTEAAVMSFRPITDHELIREHLLSTFTVDHLLVMGKPYPIREMNVIGAYDDSGALAGLIFWMMRGNMALMPAVISLSQHRGVARQLIDHLTGVARGAGAKRLRAMTTNDNTDAIRFYQLYGFKMTALFVNAIDMLRALHPGLEKLGLHGIPRRDAIELEMDL